MVATPGHDDSRTAHRLSKCRRPNRDCWRSGFLRSNRGTLLAGLRDPQNGQELWRGPLPGPAQATPMTYKISKRQFVVICSGGSAFVGGVLGDSVVAFALPEVTGHLRSKSLSVNRCGLSPAD